MTVDLRIYCHRWGGRIFACRSGSVRYACIPGVVLAATPRAASIIVFGQSVSVFDGRDPFSLPFPANKPDALGFWIGRYYVAFNRGKGEA